MFLSIRGDDPLIGPLKSTGCRVRAPRIYKSRKFAGLLLVGLLSTVGAAVTVGFAPAKPPSSKTDDYNPRDSISLDQQAPFTLPRVAEPAIEGIDTTLGGRNSVSEAHIGGQDVPIRSELNDEPLFHPPPPGSDASLAPDPSNEPSPVPSRLPDSPVPFRQLDRTALQKLTTSLLDSDHARPGQAGSPTTSAPLAQGTRRRQRGRRANTIAR